MSIKIFFIFFILISVFCFSQRIIENNNLHIFIGKKISVVEFDPNTQQAKGASKEIDPETGDTLIITHKSYVMDNAFHCKYSIIKNLMNQLPKKTIEFNAYDHYGKPDFEKHENAIMYISKNKAGFFFLQKNIYDPVYKINGQWVGILSFVFPSDHLKLWNKFKTININKDFSLKIKLGFCDKKCQKTYYPSPYFKIKDGFAYPRKAFKIDDIISYRKATIFKIKN